MANAISADMYLALTLKRAGKVKGEAAAVGHQDDIIVIGFGWGVGAAGDAVAGLATGRRSYRQLLITKRLLLQTLQPRRSTRGLNRPL